MKEDSGIGASSQREKAIQRNQELCLLREQTAMLEHARNRLEQLLSQQQELAEKIRQLDVLRVKESGDVEKLQGRSLYRLFYRISGSLDARLEKEKAEAYAAAVKYDAAMEELEAVRQDLRAVRQEAARFQGCEEQLKRLLKEKREEMKISGTGGGEQVLQMEEELAAMRQQKREIQEAEAVGNLRFADVFFDGLFIDWAVQDQISRAQTQVTAARIRLQNVILQLKHRRENLEADIERKEAEIEDVVFRDPVS